MAAVPCAPESNDRPGDAPIEPLALDEDQPDKEDKPDGEGNGKKHEASFLVRLAALRGRFLSFRRFRGGCTGLACKTGDCLINGLRLLSRKTPDIHDIGGFE